MVLGLLEEELLPTCFVFLAGGYDGPATSMYLLFYMLALYPDVQERCYQEVMVSYKQHCLKLIGVTDLFNKEGFMVALGMGSNIYVSNKPFQTAMDGETEVQYKHIQQMTYLEAVINEVNRIFPTTRYDIQKQRNYGVCEFDLHYHVTKSLFQSGSSSVR